MSLFSWWWRTWNLAPAPQPSPFAGTGKPPAPTPPPAREPANQRFAACVAITLRHEGGFVDDPRDPGGATNHGISLRYARSRGSLFDLDGDGDVDKADILLVKPAFAAEVYREWFWRDVHGEELPPGVDLAVFDFAVNSGPMRAIRHLQTAYGVTADGYFGPVTRQAIRAGGGGAWVVNRLCAGRLSFLMGLPGWAHYGKGWGRRVSDIRAHALAMTGG